MKKLILDTISSDGSYILLFNGPDLEAFSRKARDWLRENVDQNEYHMRFLPQSTAFSLQENLAAEFLFEPERSPFLFFNLANESDIVLFKVALSG